MKLPDIPLQPCVPRRCREFQCRAMVTEYRWSPFFCPPHDIERMERIDKSMEAIAARFEPQASENQEAQP